MIRDRMGVKPLYFYPTPDGVLFGSEPKAIFANPGAAPAVDLDGLRELLVPARTPGRSVWKGMREVEPGTSVISDRAPSLYRGGWSIPKFTALIHRASQAADEAVLLGCLVEDFFMPFHDQRPPSR